MDLLDKLNHYISSQAYPRKNLNPAEVKETSHPFVTISRETGAGGHSLANALLEEMAKRKDPLFTGWKVFDAHFCARLLEDAKLQASLESLHKEETRSLWEETFYELAGGRAASDRIFHKTFQAMKLLAMMGKVIIIGRGGASAAGGLPFGIHVRLVAPLALRMERMKQRLQISDTNAKRMAEDYDVERAKFVRAHFGQDIQDPLLYHAIWNTDRMSFEEIANYLVEMIKAHTPQAAVV